MDYYWPPRPNNAINDAMLGFYDQRGWINQVKMNGTCSNISVVGQEVFHYNRHNEPHRAWVAPKYINDFLLKIANGKDICLIGELMHNKTPNIKNMFFLFDIVHCGHFLLGKTYQERHDLLKSLFDIRDDHPYWYTVNENFVIAKNGVNHRTTFKKIVDANCDEYEGIVMKNPNTKLGHCNKETANSAGMIKCRKPHKNYGF